MWNPERWDGLDRPRQERLGEVPFARDLVELIESGALHYPDAVALKIAVGRGKPLVLSWAELWRRVRARAALIRAAGLGRGDRVLLILPNNHEFIECFFGAILAGAVPVPLSPPTSLKGAPLAARLADLQSVAKDCWASGVVASSAFLLVIRGALHEVNPNLRFVSTSDHTAPVDAARFERPDPEDLAFLQYTSGSTSHPKGVAVRHRNVIANVDGFIKLVGDPQMIGVSWLPLYHDMGLIGTLIGSLYMRTPAVILSPLDFIKDPRSWFTVMSEHDAMGTCAPNFAFNYCLKRVPVEAIPDVRLDSLRVALNGAEPVDPDSVAAFEARYAPLGMRPGVVLPVYGLAEATLAVSFHEGGRFLTDQVDAERIELEGVALPAAADRRSREIISVGHAIPGHQVAIIDPDGNPLPERAVGEIVAIGPSVTAGYFGHPRATAECFDGDRVRTGDRGYIAAGRLYIVGRIKDMLIRNGRNYYPQDIEFHVTRVSGVRKGCVVALCLEDGPETRIALVVETREEADEPRAAMSREIQQRLHDAFHFGADEIHYVPPGSIPKTTSGKVRRQLCKTRLLDGTLGPAREGGYGTLVAGVARSLWASRRSSSPQSS